MKDITLFSQIIQQIARKIFQIMDEKRIFSTNQSTSIAIFNILYLYQPKLKKYHTNEFIVSSTILEKEVVTKDIQHSLEYSITEKLLLNKYKNSVLYTAVVIINYDGKINCSSTIANQFP